MRKKIKMLAAGGVVTGVFLVSAGNVFAQVAPSRPVSTFSSVGIHQDFQVAPEVEDYVSYDMGVQVGDLEEGIMSGREFRAVLQSQGISNSQIQNLLSNKDFDDDSGEWL